MGKTAPDFFYKLSPAFFAPAFSSRHPETGSLVRLTKDLGTKCVFAAYIRRIAVLLLRSKDLDDRQGLSRPFTLREPCTACIYTAKIKSIAIKLRAFSFGESVSVADERG